MSPGRPDREAAAGPEEGTDAQPADAASTLPSQLQPLTPAARETPGQTTEQGPSRIPEVQKP